MRRSTCLLFGVGLAFATVASASNVGRRLPSEKTTYTDPVTGVTVTVLTTAASNDSKPYQTHPTWTADGQWILFRADRGGGNGSQAFLVNEKTGDIIQLTDAPGVGTGSLNLARKSNRLFFMRGGPTVRRGETPPPDAPPPPPRQLIELALDPLIADAMAGAPQEAAAYERVVATLPADLRDAGGFGLDADETAAYWGVAWGPLPPRPPDAPPREARTAGDRSAIDSRNMDPAERREAARKRFAEAGRGPGGIRRIDLRTGEVSKVIDVEFRMGHVQANPWVPGEIIYCHETTGDGPQRMWTVKADGTGNRALYAETPDEWVTHETVSAPDEVMFNILCHLPYLGTKPSGVAVVNLRTDEMRILGQNAGRGFWHCNGSPDGRWAVADDFNGDITLIDRRSGEQTVL
ncbi:MAG TPA: hypothetical protein VEB66_15335, partial [Opitutaceae bacterium]|nr:hypothetical protein [Opitutaceae bacterium]